MQVFNNYIICTIKEDSTYTSSGVYRGLQKEKPIILEVKETGDKINIPIEKGDIILVSKFSGTEIEIHDKEFVIVRETDVVAKLEKGDIDE